MPKTATLEQRLGSTYKSHGKQKYIRLHISLWAYCCIIIAECLGKDKEIGVQEEFKNKWIFF